MVRQIGFSIVFAALAVFCGIAGAQTESFPSGPFEHSKVGIEQEYEARKTTKPGDTSNQKSLLNFVRDEFGGSKVRFEIWEKFETRVPLFQGSFTDAKGRLWAVVPEKMNGEEFDGFELIAPPLTSEDDVEKFTRAIDAIRRSGLFVRGASSATQFTYDVSHLVGPLQGDPQLENRNIAEFVDVILFLESSLPALYEIVAPRRYGHIINSYAVPLSVNQKDLLNELAALPRSERTFGRVRGIFKKFENLEKVLFPRETSHAWKFRAFNYGKLFGLGDFKEWRLPVVEVRIADLVQDGATMKMFGTLFARVIRIGARTPQTSFQDPFSGHHAYFEGTPLHTELDNHVRHEGPAAAERLLKVINRGSGLGIKGRCEAIFAH